MPPKLDPSQVLDISVRVAGGEVGAASSRSCNIGPLRLTPKKEGEDITMETATDWNGLQVTVQLTVQNRQQAEVGNISLDNVLGIAKILGSTIQEMLGICVSVGCTVDGKDPRDVQQEIDDGEIEIADRRFRSDCVPRSNCLG